MISAAPTGKEKWKWLGPAFIWMLSAAGSGELLFTPRIASQYGYTLIWALLLAVAMKWFINREIGRYTVCTGAAFFRGLASLQNKRWMLWLIIVPQLVVAVATVAGLAGAAATAIIVLIDIPLWIPVVVLTIATAMIIVLGGFKTVEKVTTVLAILISLSVLSAALATGPDTGKMINGLVPAIPAGLQTGEVLPWLGFMLAGAAGLMWFSYWTAARGYGAASLKRVQPVNPAELSKDDQNKLKGWIRHMTFANSLAVAGALVIAFAFLVLGTELLQPRGLVPEENRVAEVLGQLLGGIWGTIGFWFMIGAVFITFTSTMLSDQDGFGRMFTDGTAILASNNKRQNSWLKNTRLLNKIYVTGLLTFCPIVIYLTAGNPVGLLKLAGVIEAAHIPVVTGSILYLNKKTLPKNLQPSTFSLASTIIAGLFFAVFAIAYILQRTGLIGG
ncbi:Nramp family divalent metal transporter [Niastella populi]|uniref:Nramp family divalent metal transporter n=1 Tax=Niastella populi TaxID=550983 RepID=UPI001A992F31|nr:Nramp family divalent metal transporter [Niastella populi]